MNVCPINIIQVLVCPTSVSVIEILVSDTYVRHRQIS